MDKRNNELYKDYINGVSIEDIAIKYNLKPSTTKGIINEYKRLHSERYIVMDELYEYLKLHLDLNIATRVYNSINRYLTNNNIYKREDIKDIFIRDKYIRSIGGISKKLIKEYFEIE